MSGWHEAETPIVGPRKAVGILWRSALVITALTVVAWMLVR